MAVLLPPTVNRWDLTKMVKSDDYQKRPFVHNSVCSQFLEGLFAILRGNPSFCWLGWGGLLGAQKLCEQTFCEQTSAFPRLITFHPYLKARGFASQTPEAD